MPNTFNFMLPDAGAQKSHEPRVKVISFGDGYEQRVGDGINKDAEVWELSWTGKTQAEIQAIDTFLKGEAGVTWFYWTTPEGVQKKFVCKRWSVRYFNSANADLTATFKQDFGI